MGNVLAAACSADDLRAAGYEVDMHRDARSGDGLVTVWVMRDKQGLMWRGEGVSDAEALNKIRAKAGLPVPPVVQQAIVPQEQHGALLFEAETAAMLRRLKERLYEDRPLTSEQRRDLANTLDAIMHRAVALG